MEVAASLFLSLALFAAIRVLSVLGMPLALFAAAPLAVLCIRRGESVFLATAAAASMGAALLLGGGSAAGAYALTVAFPALLIARGLAFQWRPEKIVGIAAVVIAAMALMALAAVLPDGIKPWIDQLVADNIAAYRAAGAPADVLATLEQQSDFYAQLMYDVMPMAFVWSGMGLTVASMLAVRAYFARRPHPAVTLATPINRWYLPDVVVWAFIIATALALLPLGGLRVLGGNLMGVLAMAYALQGWAVMSYLFEHRQVHPAVQGATYMILLLWPVFVVFLVLLGLFDVWTDSRKVRDDTPSAGPDNATGNPPDDPEG